MATPTGLITPIIKDVGGKGLATISAEAKSLAKKARDGKLTIEDMAGGTFTMYAPSAAYDAVHAHKRR